MSCSFIDTFEMKVSRLSPASTDQGITYVKRRLPMMPEENAYLPSFRCLSICSIHSLTSKFFCDSVGRSNDG